MARELTMKATTVEEAKAKIAEALGDSSLFSLALSSTSSSFASITFFESLSILSVANVPIYCYRKNPLESISCTVSPNTSLG